jgi:hypothetical protein
MASEFSNYPPIYEVLTFILGILILILAPGRFFSVLLKIETKNLIEKSVFSLILGYLALNVLALSCFLFRTNFLEYCYEIFCGIISVRFVYVFFKHDVYKVRFPISNYWFPCIIYLFFFLLVQWSQINLLHGQFQWDGNENILGFLGNWDDLGGLSMVNGQIQFFLPVENPFLPGEPPFFQSWFGHLFVVFLIKFCAIDNLRAYFFWTPIFFNTTFFLLIYYLVFQFVKSKWIALWSIGFFYFVPGLALDQNPPRYLAGYFILLSSVVFFTRYYATQKTIYLFLSFNWSLLYFSKGNFLPAIFSGVVYFYLQVVFHKGFPRLDLKKLKIILCLAFFPLGLLILSRSYFPVFYLPDMINFDLFISRSLLYMGQVWPVFLLILTYYFSKLRRGEKLSSFDKLIWVSFIGVWIFSATAGRHLEGMAKTINFLGLAISGPVCLRLLLPSLKEITFKFIVPISLIAFFLVQPRMHSDPLLIPKEELELIKFLRVSTPTDSVIIHNMYRYLDRPSMLSALSYRRMFIDEGERFANSYYTALEDRLNDFWYFQLCNCGYDEYLRFFNKYPFINYFVEYKLSFRKNLNPIIGMSITSKPTPILRDYALPLFEKVFENGIVRVYKINRLKKI